MKNKIYFLVIVLALSFSQQSCKKWLDVNTNPNAPEYVEGSLYLPGIQANMAMGVQFDGRALGMYIQNWHFFTTSTTATSAYQFDRHGYAPGSDFSGDLWRNVYWRIGKNNLNLMEDAKRTEKWDLLAAGKIIQAWGWQMLTDYHGPIILDSAFDDQKLTFPYTDQEKVYSVVKGMCFDAISDLAKTGSSVGSVNFKKFDYVYKGDKTKWKKFAYGLLALNASHLSNKSIYNADSVISYVDSSLANNADNFIVPFAGNSTSDANFFGPMRDNLTSYGQSGFIVRLLNGAVYPVKDPRIVCMLSPSLDSSYRGLVPAAGQPKGLNSNTFVRTFWNTSLGTTPALPVPRQQYLFADKSPFPIMTYFQLQFIKAEAALKKGNMAMAVEAYKKGINASMDFTESLITDAPSSTMFKTLRPLYIAAVAPATQSEVTISDIMTQKYIAQYGWGFIETWCDLRRYNYNGDIFKTWAPPASDLLYTDNNGKLAQRVRPRYNSEYIYNREALIKIGAYTETNYHTVPMWFTQP